MFRIFKVMLASFAVAALGVAGLDAHVARADWSETGLDWDESASVVKTFDPDDASALADHFFHVEWTAGPGAAGRARITGYVYNDSGDSAVNVALRIHEIDASGNRRRQRGRADRRSRPGSRSDLLRRRGPRQPLLPGRRGVVRFRGATRLTQRTIRREAAARSPRPSRGRSKPCAIREAISGRSSSPAARATRSAAAPHPGPGDAADPTFADRRGDPGEPRRHVAGELAGHAAITVLAQPCDRGTAAGVLLAAHWIRSRAPGRRGRGVPHQPLHRGGGDLHEPRRRRRASTSGIIRMAPAAGRAPDRAGARPRRGSSPGSRSAGRVAARSIASARSTSRPPAELARRLHGRALCNTFVFTATATALVEAGRACLPLLHDRLTRFDLFTGTRYETVALQQAYLFAPTADFARAILASSDGPAGRRGGPGGDLVGPGHARARGPPRRGEIHANDAPGPAVEICYKRSHERGSGPAWREGPGDSG